jgi:cell division protease FtsH
MAGESTQDFAKSFRTFMDHMSAATPREEPALLRRLRAHFEADPAQLPILSHSFPSYDQANVQIGLDAWKEAAGNACEAFGVVGPHRGYQRISMSSIVTPMGAHFPVHEGPVEYESVDIGDGKTLTCLRSGLLLLKSEKSRLAVLVEGPTARMFDTKVTLEVMAPTREEGERFMHALRAGIRERNVYRGRIVSLNVDPQSRSLRVEYHRLPDVPREDIILSEGTLERIERHTIGFSQKQAKLRAAGRHLKRGLLLYGPPGTGKTFTAMYLAGRMPGRTVLLVTGRSQGLIEDTCAMARALEPATVILEDVDLIGVERDEGSHCTSPLLFELLNQMDGLAEDSDILFILTTNRPDILEPALASRPGRVDQAIEVKPPDADCRRRLIDLYGRGLNLRLADPDRIVKRTHGASAAFMKELMRRAALFAADVGDEMLVTDRELDEALHELAFQGGPLTKNLLGFQSTPPEED